jgi:hypothetical protein
MAFLDRFRKFFFEAPQPAPPKPQGPEGVQDWTAREIAAARRVDGRTPLSAEAQAGVDREIAAARRVMDAQPKADVLDHPLLQQAMRAIDQRAAENRAALSPEAQIALDRDLRAVRRAEAAPSLSQAMGFSDNVLPLKRAAPRSPTLAGPRPH